MFIGNFSLPPPKINYINYPRIMKMRNIFFLVLTDIYLRSESLRIRWTLKTTNILVRHMIQSISFNNFLLISKPSILIYKNCYLFIWTCATRKIGSLCRGRNISGHISILLLMCLPFVFALYWWSDIRAFLITRDWDYDHVDHKDGEFSVHSQHSK